MDEIKGGSMVILPSRSSGKISPGVLQLRAESQKAFEEGLALLREEVAVSPEDKALWDALPKAGRTARAFREAHRTEVVTMFLKYPSIERDGIRIHKGLERGELPFRKEFLMARLLKDILTAEGRKVRGMVLLPRYSGRMIKDVFSVDVAHSSMEDALAVSMAENGKRATEYYEFKMCKLGKFGAVMNKTLSAGARSSLIVTDGTPGHGIQLDWDNARNDHHAYVFNLKESSAWDMRIDKEKRRYSIQPIQLRSKSKVPLEPSIAVAYSRQADASSLDIGYLDELRSVDRDAIIDYAEYLCDTGYARSSKKGLRELEALLVADEPLSGPLGYI